MFFGCGRVVAVAEALSHLDAEVEALRVLHELCYWIEQRIGDGPWLLKCRYGDDLAYAIARVQWWNRLLRGRRRYRVVSVLGTSRTVVYAEGSADA
jgi:hypothetical protein